MSRTSPDSEPAEQIHTAKLWFEQQIENAKQDQITGFAVGPAVRGERAWARHCALYEAQQVFLKVAESFDLAPCLDLPGMQGAVQYRRKDGGYGDRWITMAMFDGTLAAESYCSQQRKDDAWPFEYRVIGLPASPDTSTDRTGK